jgi:hypothetical protein
MNETSKAAPAKRAAAPQSPAPATAPDQRIETVLGLLSGLGASHSQLFGLISDMRGAAEATQAEVHALHAKLDALTERADEAEKLLNSPGAKLAKGVAKVWNGLG